MKQFRDTKYYITENGDVYRLWKFKGYKKLKPRNIEGYLRIGLRKNGIQTQYFIHRLVGECYIENRNNKLFINHIDGNKLNNNITNLEWVTNSENMLHAFKTGLQKPIGGTKHYNSKLTIKQVNWIKNNYIPQNKKFGCNALSKKFKVSPSQISNIINQKSYKTI